MRFIVGFLTLVVVVGTPAFAQVESLPPPVVHGNSFEIISNSGYSSHSGFTSSLSDTVLSNVLWAMRRVPSFGSSYREIYVATPTNVCFYDTAAHVLNVPLPASIATVPVRPLRSASRLSATSGGLRQGRRQA
jgi:hypothetical protein